MNFFAVCAFLLVLVIGSITATPSGNGQPGCKTEQEITDRVYRNFYDSSAYWVCSELGVPASMERCDDEEGFLYSERKCVPWEDWTWEPLIAPLSKP